MAEHVLKYQDRHGHSTMTFDPTNAEQVDEVERKFDELIHHGYMGAVEAPSGEMVGTRRFDPEAKETIVVLPIAGG